MNFKSLSIGIFVFTIFLSACSTSNQVVSNKRKLNKRFTITQKKNPSKSQKAVVANLEKREKKSFKPSNFSLLEKTDGESIVYASKEPVNMVISNTIGSKQQVLSPVVKSTEHVESYQSQNNLVKLEKQVFKSMKKEAKKSKRSSNSGKSQLVALLLVAFVGAVGIHRFYLGYIGVGIIQLLTGGGCGIWALIDLVRIITGDLKPINGDYTDKL